MPHRGVVAFWEVDVDGMVRNSSAGDVTGTTPMSIGDTEGLAIDLDTNATFRHYWHNSPQYTNYDLDHLLISGTTLSGCGVISSVGMGSIATLNGTPLAATAPTPSYGRRMGLRWIPPNQTTSHTYNLEAIAEQPNYFATATATPDASSSYKVHVGTNLDLDPAFPFCVLLLGFADLPVSASGDAATMPSIGSFFTNNKGFDEYYLRHWPSPWGTSPFPIMISHLISMTPDGDGYFGFETATFPAGFTGGLLYQAVAGDMAGNFHFSTPGTIE